MQNSLIYVYFDKELASETSNDLATEIDQQKIFHMKNIVGNPEGLSLFNAYNITILLCFRTSFPEFYYQFWNITTHEVPFYLQASRHIKLTLKYIFHSEQQHFL